MQIGRKEKGALVFEAKDRAFNSRKCKIFQVLENNLEKNLRQNNLEKDLAIYV